MPLLVSLIVLLTAICVGLASAAEDPENHGRYIVVLKDSVDRPGSIARAQVEQREGRVGFVYRNALKGYSAELPKHRVEGLRNDPRVKYVTPDHRLQPFVQAVPTGIDRIFATANEGLDIDEEDDLRVDADVAVIDSGIAYEHEDLNVVERTDCSTKEGEAFVCVDNSGTDTFGHGTHVAGTIGALDNGSGVVGVAPGVRLWAVKVYLSFPTAAFESSTVAGVDWVTAHSDEIEVANMSIGCTEGFALNCSLPALESAVSTAVQEGVVMVAAAGNEKTNAAKTHPASNPDVITVSAIEDLDGSAGAGNDPRASFSNFGSTIEVAAPGVSILSTYPEGGYTEMSGTSMASPHVAGAAAILTSQSDPESQEDVEAIRDTIVEEGNLNWNDTSGDGIQEPLLDVSNEEVFAPGEPEEPEAPTATTEAATSVTITGAKLNGTVNPNGAKTTYQFEYGTTTSYGSKAPGSPKEIGSGSEGVAVNETIGGLEPNTTYHFRVVATNAGGTAYGEDKTFKTQEAKAPSATSESGTGVTHAGAKLNGTVNPNGTSTTYQFEYGTTTEYGSKAPASPKGIGSGVSGVEVNETIGGLEPNTTYHFRVVATNAAGTVNGADKTFVTSEAPEGSEWEIQPTPNPSEAEGHEAKLNDVSCKAGQCMAVGRRSDPEVNGPLVELWDGEEWSLNSSPSGVSELNGVSCLTTKTCLVVGGKSGQAWIGAWHATPGWGSLPMENIGAFFSVLNGASCLDDGKTVTECWAVGSYTKSGETRALAMRWNTSFGIFNAYATPAVGEGSELSRVSCNTVGSCVAVGHYVDPEFGEKRPLALRWNGSTWSTEELPGVEAEGEHSYLSGVSCTGEAEPSCMAVGTNEGVGVMQTALAMRLGGEEWSMETPEVPGAPEEDFTLKGVSCLSESECFATGSYEVEASETRTLIEEWNGEAWIQSISPNPEGSLKNELTAVSCVASASDCVAVGSSSPSLWESDTLAMHHE